MRGAGGSLTVRAEHRDAYSLAPEGLPDDLRASFLRGRSLFRQVWVVAPSEDAAVDGLGPVYNRMSCGACHVRNGRGFAPDGPDEEMRAMLMRISQPGARPDEPPHPHPAYGDQINESGIPGIPGEGEARVTYTIERVTLAGGESVELRRPVFTLHNLRFGAPKVQLLMSARVAPPVYGLGLLEAVDETTLRALAERPGMGAGRVNRVLDVRKGELVTGRFGLKSNQPHLRQQNAAAAWGDIGITSDLFRTENCAAPQVECASAPHGGTPELDARQLEDLTVYMSLLPVPARRGERVPDVFRGERLFNDFGCSQCHVPELTTGNHPRFAQLSRQTIRPYSDLLLHDLGPDLADGRPDFAASGGDWRTPPLWGIGLAHVVNPRAGFLHDGRARTLQEAILWHGGQARPARESFRLAPLTDRSALVRFLESL